MNLAAAKALVDSLFASYAHINHVSGASILSSNLQKGKVYEAWILAEVLEKLKAREGYTVTLVGGPHLILRSAGGPIDAGYAHFLLRATGRVDLEIWTDIWFLTLGFALRADGNRTSGDFHELDIVAVPAGTSGYPTHGELVIGIECKATAFKKQMFREVIGVRRELSYLHAPTPTSFISWPNKVVPAWPPSSLLVYSTSKMVTNYRLAGEVFGLRLSRKKSP